MQLNQFLAPILASVALALIPALPTFAGSPPPALTFSVEQFTLSDPLPIEQDKVERILAGYTGRQIGINELREAAKTLEQHVRDRGWAFYRIILPPQTLNDGEVQLQVIDFRVGSVAVSGNEHFPDENIRNMVPALVAGSSPNIHRLAEAVRYANRHPSKRMELLFREGQSDQTVDATLQVRDEREWSGFGILRNTGNDATGDWRLSIGGQHTNLFKRDHTFNVTATTSPGAHYHDDVKQLGVSYGIPFYHWGGAARAYFAKSDVDSGIIENFFDVRGAGKVSGISLTKYLPRIQGKYDHEVEASVEDKHFENDIRFTPSALVTPPGAGDVRSRPLGFKYGASRETAVRRYGLHIKYLTNLSGGSDNSSAAYDRVRVDSFGAPVDASRDWSLLQFGGFGNFSFTNEWRLNFDLSGQWTNDALIPGEQFGVGGLASVRGYEEREIAGDSGYTLRLETVAPPLVRNLNTHMFFDHGYRDLNEPQGVLNGHDRVSSTGVGMRYSFGPVALRLDLAWALDDAASTDRSDFTLHSYLVVKF